MNDKKEFLKQLRRLAITKQLNFLIGSGCSMPALPLFTQVEGKSDDERNQNLLQIISDVSKNLRCRQEFPYTIVDKKIEKTLQTYIEFLQVVINVLNISNSRLTPKNANIFTTNYDLFIEVAMDRVIKNNRLFFNDGGEGYFERYLDSANYNKTMSYKGLNDNYISDIPTVSLIKPHGSVNWEKSGEYVRIKNKVLRRPVIVKPTGLEGQDTFLNNHFHAMLRLFQLELDKEQSVLFVIGFSFQDKHIGAMVRRAIKNPELMIYVFGFSENDRKIYLANLGITTEPPRNLKIITPNDELFEVPNGGITLSELTAILSNADLGDLEDDAKN